MDIMNVPFSAVDWSKVPETLHRGERGFATWKSFEAGNIRVRLVEYSPDYLADHWCERGHVIHILEGEMVSELRDGTKTPMSAGMSYFMSNDPANPHRSSTTSGVKLFIVD
jgi:quercetin dioxygenase-like cupin family protein